MTEIFPFRRPPELDSGRSELHPVLIAGAGPVGLALALELARFGVRSVVLEPRDRIDPGSRAICISRRSMDILDGIGVGEEFRAAGLGWVRGRSYYRQHLVFELEMPFPPLEKHFPMTNLQQSTMEQILAAEAARRPEVDLRWQSRLRDVSQDAERVRGEVETPAGRYALEGAWLVACDGARSAVRERLGLRLEGFASPGRYLIADIRMKSAHPTERRVWFDPPCNPGSTAIMHKQPGDVWRVDFQILGDRPDAEELDERRVCERIGSLLEMIGERAPWGLLWTSVYRAYGLALPRYRHGRVLFAGDAAHLVPIFGVRGLNSGFADANNLGWKLAHCLRGLASDALLDSYDLERRAATQDILRQAAKSTVFMTPPSEGERILRDAVLSLAIRHPFVRPLIDPRQSVPYDYRESPLNSFDAGERAEDAAVPTGAPLPNVRVAGSSPASWQPRHLGDGLGPDFCLLLFEDDAAGSGRAESLERALACAGVAFRLVVVARSAGRAEERGERRCILDPECALREALGARDGTLLIVRPDGHLCARLHAPSPARVVRALERALQREGEGARGTAARRFA